MAIDLEGKYSIVGRSAKDIEKYGSKGTGYLGKVVLSSGENPVLGRKILTDLSRPHVMLICGKRGGGKCLTGDSLITLADGQVVPINELENDERNVLSLGTDLKISSNEKTEFFKRKVNKLLKIKLRSGKEIKLTPEHPLLTVKGWLPAEELNIGSRIATPRKIFVENPIELEENKIKLLAYFIAEGHLGNNFVLFSNVDEKIISDFNCAINEFDYFLKTKNHGEFDYHVVANEKRIISKNIRVNGKFSKGIGFDSKSSIRKWLDELGIYDIRSNSKFVPGIIFSLKDKQLSLFLNRLFSCDGTIYFDSNTSTWRISYGSSSEKLIRQVQHLLSRFEIYSSLRKKHHKLNGKKFESFELDLIGINVDKFLKKIGFFGEKEMKQLIALQEISEIQRNPNLDTIPKELWDFYTPDNWAEIGRAIGYKHPKALRESINYSPSRQKLLQIAEVDQRQDIKTLARADIFWDEIKEIEELIGEFDVYDLSVPGNHNFIANDIIVHNSYSMAVMVEEFAKLPLQVRQRLAVIVIDTVGIFWSLKVPNEEQAKMLSDWDLKPEGIDAKVWVPKGKLDFYVDRDLPVDGAFTLKASELEGLEWMALFGLTWKDPEGVLITRVVEKVKEKMGTYFGIDELISATKSDDESEELTKQALVSRLMAAKGWGLIEKEGTKIMDLVKPGSINIIDVSSYRQAVGMEGTKEIIVGLLGKRLFEERMLYRKEEEAKLIKGQKRESKMPVVWMFIDEAHMFMPKDRESVALKVLLEWVRVGRQPGLSLCLATQRPNKLHPDAISQCDLFVSHRMTAKSDIEAVAQLRPSYLHQNFDKYFQQMPKAKGFALILDDNSEKLWMVKVRPRLSWDAGVTASAFTD